MYHTLVVYLEFSLFRDFKNPLRIFLKSLRDSVVMLCSKVFTQ